MSAADSNGTSRVIAVSVSDSQDMDVLGLLEGEDKRVLSAVLTPLIYRGARVAYGGRITPHSETNFTTEISTQLAAAYRQSGGKAGTRPYIHYLRGYDARREGSEALFAHALRLGAFSEIKLLNGLRTCATLLPAGNLVDVHVDEVSIGAARSAVQLKQFDAVATVFKGSNGRDELAEMRKAMAGQTDARIVMGGRVAGTAGGTSGVAAEALATLQADKPLLALGGIGGASRDVAAKLGLIDEAERVHRDESAYRDSRGEPSMERYWSHMDQFNAFEATYTRMLSDKGLLDAARRLAISDTFAEIGALVVELLDALLPSDGGRLTSA